MLNQQIVDFIIAKCESRYNLADTKLTKRNTEDKGITLAWKRSDLELTAKFKNAYLSEVIYNNFLDDFQIENMTENEFKERFDDVLAIRDIDTASDLEDIVNRIIKSVNSGKLFTAKEREGIILDSEYRAKLRYIKIFFGNKAQEGKLLEELQELQEAVQGYKKSFYTKNEENILEEIADCLVVGIQLKKTKLVLNMIKGIIEKPSLINTTAIEKIIEIVKAKINRTVVRIEKGEYGSLMIGHDENANGAEKINSEKEIEVVGEGTKGNDDIETSFVLSEEELRSIVKKEIDIEDSGEKKKKILIALSKNTPFLFRSKELSELTEIKAKECTQLIVELILEGSVIITKKGKDRLYGATLGVNTNEVPEKKSKSTNTIIMGGSAVGMHAKGTD